MVDVLADSARAVLDHGAVGGIDPLHVEGEQAPQRREVVEQITVVGRNHGGGAAEDDVAGEERALLHEVVAEMIGRVAGRVDGDEGHALAVHGLAVAQILDRLRQAGVPVAHLRHAQAAEALAQLLDAAEVIAVAVRQQDA